MPLRSAEPSPDNPYEDSREYRKSGDRNKVGAAADPAIRKGRPGLNALESLGSRRSWCHHNLDTVRVLQPSVRSGKYWKYQHRDLRTTQDLSKC